MVTEAVLVVTEAVLIGHWLLLCTNSFAVSNILIDRGTHRFLGAALEFLSFGSCASLPDSVVPALTTSMTLESIAILQAAAWGGHSRPSAPLQPSTSGTGWPNLTERV